MLALSVNFFGTNTKSSGNKAKINKWDYTEIKSFCMAMETTNKMKKQPIIQRKYLQKMLYFVMGLPRWR